MSFASNIQPSITVDTYNGKQANHLLIALVLSSLLHLAVLFGVSFEFPAPDSSRIATSLEVVLVNSKTEIKPVDTELLAQSNLDGGGNVDENRRAKTPFPVIPKSKPAIDHFSTEEKVKKLEQEQQQLMTALQSEEVIPLTDADQIQPEKQDAIPDAADLLQRSLDIARLKAQIAEDHEAYQKRPKRKFVGARTTEYRFARYVEDWRLKVERIGNLNYPEDAKRQKLYGNLQLTVGIRADGSLESIGINRSSGIKVLDDAAIRIVRLAGKNGFAPFPPDISRDTDILHITRTWVFARSDTLMSQ